MKKILIIDNDKLTREIMFLFFANQDYQVYMASDGYSGLEVIRRINVDLVIIDYKIDNIDGIEVIKKVKEINPHTQILVLTAYNSITSVIQTMKTGVCGYLQKPIKLDEFSTIVNKILHIRRPRFSFQISRNKMKQKI